MYIVAIGWLYVVVMIAVVSDTLLKAVVQWPWLAKQAGISREQIHFLRKEALDTSATERLAGRMGVHKPQLAPVLAKTTTWLLAQQATSAA